MGKVVVYLLYELYRIDIPAYCHESFCSWIFTYIWKYVDICWGFLSRQSNSECNAEPYVSCLRPWNTSSNSVPKDVLVMKWSNKNIAPHTPNCDALFLHMCSKLDDITFKFCQGGKRLSGLIHRYMISTLQLGALDWLTRLQLHMWPPPFLYTQTVSGCRSCLWLTYVIHTCMCVEYVVSEAVYIVCTQIESLWKALCTDYRESFLRVVWRWRAVQDMFCFGFDEVQGFNCDQGNFVVK